MKKMIKEHDVTAIALPEGVLQAENSRASDFWELTKPRLTFLVLVTTFVGFCMGAQSGIDWILFVHTMMGTAFVAGGAAVLNQVLEKDFDALMKRTKDRPLPAGRLQVGEALLFGAALSVLGLFYLTFAVNLLTSTLAALTVGSYLFLYTPMKRLSPLCTIVGAVPGAIPPMMGWTAATGSIDAGAWILFTILFLWQMPHFYALAQLYREDYARGGFPMLSVVDKQGTRLGMHILVHTFLLIPVSVAPFFFGMTGKVYLVGALLLTLSFFAFSISAAYSRSTKSCKRLFLASIFYLPFILMLMVANKITP
jgi:heme o synthase